MTLNELAFILICGALVVLWRVEKKLNQILSSVGSIAHNMDSIKQKVEEIGDSVHPRSSSDR
jgi:hypothetical protein